MWAMLKFQNKRGLRSSGGPFMVFFFPLVLLLLFGYIFESPGGEGGGEVMIAGLVTYQALAITLGTFGFSFKETQTSVLQKQIGASNLSKPMYFSSLLAYNFLLILAGSIGIMLGGVLLIEVGYINVATNVAGTGETFSGGNVQGGAYIYGVLINIIMSFAIAMFFLSITKTIEQYMVLVNFYFLLGMFLSGIFFPQITLVNPDDASGLYGLSYAIPHQYSDSFMKAAFYGQIDFAAGGYGGYKLGLDFSIPIAISIGLGAVIYKKFSGDS